MTELLTGSSSQSSSTSPTQNTPSRYIEDIIALRGIAIGFVLLTHMHYGLLRWSIPILDQVFSYIGGGFGVDIFFAISGFVISRDLMPKLMACTNTKSFIYTSLAFWIRRAWRILPSAWLWLAIILIFTAVFNKSGAFNSMTANLYGTIAAIFQVYNYWFVKCFGHYDCGANFFYWTLSLEEQFYLLLPLAIFLCRKHMVFVIACLVAFQLCYTDRPAWLVMFRTDALLLGVLIAIWEKKQGYRIFENRFITNSRWLRSILVVGLLVILIMDTKIYKGSLAPFGLTIAALASAAIVLIASYDKNYLVPSGAFKRKLIWLGERSCSIYLIHVPAFYLTKEIWYRIAPNGTIFDASYTIQFILTGFGLVYILGECNYRFLELPSRKKGRIISAHFIQKHANTT
jgi:peptidoglycan/LPS O-acetylase OafA/YrhL